MEALDTLFSAITENLSFFGRDLPAKKENPLLPVKETENRGMYGSTGLDRFLKQ